ncbi:MAG: hypothetical protein ACK5X3_23175 [Pseudomonadota bacterium]|jgi:hypothetical protein
MTERPILFSAEMVRAILDGRKTQTRRAIKPVPTFNGGGACHDADALQQDYVEPYWVFPETCKYGAPGDLLWVREAHAFSANPDLRPWYRLDHPEARSSGPRVDVKWRPSIHMPRWASRITLRITDVRVERLQDVSRQDCVAEGCAGGHGSIPGYPYSATPREHFHHLWNTINGAGAWDANPWVWVLSFERVKP